MQTFTLNTSFPHVDIVLSSIQLNNITQQGDIGPHVIRIASRADLLKALDLATLQSLCIELDISFTGLSTDKIIQSLIWAAAWKIHASPDLYLNA